MAEFLEPSLHVVQVPLCMNWKTWLTGVGVLDPKITDEGVWPVNQEVMPSAKNR